MDLELTEDQEELRDSVRNFLSKECPPSLVRQMVDTGTNSDDLWQAMVGLDWPGLAIDEEFGGVGLGFAEVAVVAEELGAALAPVPFLPTLTQFVPVVREAGSVEQRHRFLTPVTTGATGAFAFADKRRGWRIDDLTMRAVQSPGGWTLNGAKQMVMASQSTDELVVAARIGDAPTSVGLFILPSGAVTIEALHALDPTRPLSTVTFEHVEVATDRVLGDPGSPEVAIAVARALQEAATGLALETMGTATALLERLLAYTKERHQFGVPIGSFQAVKHKLADLFVEVQRASSLCRYAVAAITEDNPSRDVAVAMAKAASDDCQRKICMDTIQLFGGIAFTWDHDAHLFVKRAMSSGALFGDARQHRLTVAEAMGVWTWNSVRNSNDLKRRKE